MNFLKRLSSNKFFHFIFIVPIMFSLSGCVYLIVGGVGVLGGYIVSPDTVEGITENDADVVFDAASEIIGVMGLIQEQSQETGTILASVSGAEVTVVITPLSDSAVKLSVKARKRFFPKISVAQDVFVKVMSHLNE